MSAWVVTMGAGATMGSCIRRLPFHPKERLGPQSITWASEMAKHNSGVNQYLDSGEFCIWPKLNTRGYPSTLWLPTERVRRKGYPLAQAHCTPCAQALGLCVWLTPPPLQAPMAACDP